MLTRKIPRWPRYFTKVPHIGGSPVQKEYGEYIRREWEEFGMDKVEMLRYDILLSFPEEPGAVSIVNAQGVEEFRTAPQEEFLIPEENNSNVVPPFNAYSPNGTVRVGWDSLGSYSLCFQQGGLSPHTFGQLDPYL